MTTLVVSATMRRVIGVRLAACPGLAACPVPIEVPINFTLYLRLALAEHSLSEGPLIAHESYAGEDENTLLVRIAGA